MKLAIKNTYKNLSNVDIKIVEFTNAKNRKQWAKYLKYSPLDIIYQFPSIQENILNMYEKISLCGESIVKYKKISRKSFDYIINTREDLIVLKDMDLKKLLPNIRNTKLSSTRSKCDLLSKGCLEWGGINTKFWILSERNGINFMTSIISWYKRLIRIRRKIYNPETFDLVHLKYLGLKYCGISVDGFPVTAARHTFDGNYCLRHIEYSDCIPRGMKKYVKSIDCDNY